MGWNLDLCSFFFALNILPYKNLTMHNSRETPFPPVFTTQASWSLVEEFNTQYEELLAQTWLELRPRLFVVQDLASTWMTKLREVPRDQVTHMLSQEVQRLEQAHPALKAMTGEPFERDHWRILFGLIKLPPDLRLEELRFKDLAQRLNIIVDKVDELKELTARAIGEVTIRDAVMEVSAWFEQAEFNLMDHQVGIFFVQNWVQCRWGLDPAKSLPFADSFSLY